MKIFFFKYFTFQELKNRDVRSKLAENPAFFIPIFLKCSKIFQLSKNSLKILAGGLKKKKIIIIIKPSCFTDFVEDFVPA